jgi:hypothetical protein
MKGCPTQEPRGRWSVQRPSLFFCEPNTLPSHHHLGVGYVSISAVGLIP